MWKKKLSVILFPGEVSNSFVECYIDVLTVFLGVWRIKCVLVVA